MTVMLHPTRFFNVILPTLLLTLAQNEVNFTSNAYFLSLEKGIPNLPVYDGPSITHEPTTTQTTVVSMEDLIYYNYFAASSYCASQLKDLSCRPCQHFNKDVRNLTLIHNKTLSTLAYVTVQPGRREIIVTFQGSYNVGNLLWDIGLIQVDALKNPKIRVHEGFLVAMMSLYYRVVVTIHVYLKECPNYKVVLLGHSLGGCMASLTQFFLSYKEQFPGVNTTLVTFGQPRLGNKGFVDFMNSLPIPMARVVERADIIVHAVPADTLEAVIGEPYYHHMREVWNNDKEVVYCNDTVYEDPNCSDSLDPFYSVADHMRYFETDYATCFFADPGHLLTLPHVIDTQTMPLPIVPQRVIFENTEVIIGELSEPIEKYLG